MSPIASSSPSVSTNRAAPAFAVPPDVVARERATNLTHEGLAKLFPGKDVDAADVRVRLYNGGRSAMVSTHVVVDGKRLQINGMLRELNEDHPVMNLWSNLKPYGAHRALLGQDGTWRTFPAKPVVVDSFEAR